MQKEELALLDMEMMGRERLAKAAEDKAAAEASGELAVARASERLLQLEARIDRIKQQLFFPSVKGYTCVPCSWANCISQLQVYKANQSWC